MRFYFLLLSILFSQFSHSQNARLNTISYDTILPDHRLKAKDLVVPGILTGYGFWALNSNEIKRINQRAKRKISPGKYYYKTSVDDFLQYTPAVAVYGLNAFGIKGENNLRDRTVIYIMATIITCSFITPLKGISKVERPDGSACNSFPSGHTATAFAAAEFLRQEYKTKSPWYGILGYAVATTTGILRVYNNRHWVSDIVAGAGIGIISTKISYWAYPEIKKLLFKDKPRRLTAEDLKNLNENNLPY